MKGIKASRIEKVLWGLDNETHYDNEDGEGRNLPVLAM